MKASGKLRVFLALYHRGKLSLPPHRDEQGLASFHWALLIAPKNAAESTHMLDVTNAMQIDPVRHIDTNPDRKWIFRDKVENPLSNIRLVLIAMVGKMKSRAKGLEKLVGILKKECRVPNEDNTGENCVWWVKTVVRLLLAKDLLDDFNVDGTFTKAQRLASSRLDGANLTRERAQVVNFTSRVCDVSFHL